MRAGKADAASARSAREDMTTAALSTASLSAGACAELGCRWVHSMKQPVALLCKTGCFSKKG